MPTMGEFRVTVLSALAAGAPAAGAAEAGTVWEEAAEALRAQLAGTTIADVAEREARQAGAQMYYI